MSQEKYKKKGRAMTLNFLEEKDLFIHMYGYFNLSSENLNNLSSEHLNVYHDPADLDPESFHFESPHAFKIEFVDKIEAVSNEI